MTIRARLTDIANAIGGGSQSPPNDLDDRFVLAVEKIAECLCNIASRPPEGEVEPQGIGCVSFRNELGNVVSTPFDLEGQGTTYTDNPVWQYVTANASSGAWRLAIRLEGNSGESTGVVISVTASNGATSTAVITPSMGEETQNYDFDAPLGGSVVIASQGGGYNTDVLWLSLCKRAASISTPVVLSSGIPLRSGYSSLMPAPIAGRPFFGPFAWQPVPRTTFADIMAVGASGMQEWAGGWAETLDPTTDFVLTLRAFGETYQQLGLWTLNRTLAQLQSSGAVSFDLLEALPDSVQLMVSLAPSDSALNNQLAQLANQFQPRITVSLEGE